MAYRNEESLKNVLLEFCEHFQSIGSKVILEYNEESMGEREKIGGLASKAGSILKGGFQCAGMGAGMVVGIVATGNPANLFSGLAIGSKIGEAAGDKVNNIVKLPFASIHKRKARKISMLIGYYNNTRNKIKLNEILFCVALEIFASFEWQFVHISQNVHWQYALRKLARDAIVRAMNYINKLKFLEDVCIPECSELILKGILYGNSKESVISKLIPRFLNGFPVGNKLMPHPGRTFQTTSESWISAEFWSKPGVTDGQKFCYSVHCNVEKFGFRRILSFENISDFPLENHGYTHDSYEYKAYKNFNEYHRLLNNSLLQVVLAKNETSVTLNDHHYIGKFWPRKIELINAFVNRFHVPDKSVADYIMERLSIAGELVVTGCVGTGKSTIAKWLSNKYENNYDHIFWLDCRNENAFRKCIAQLAASIGIASNEVKPLETITREIYTRFEGKNCLVNFDGAEDYARIRSILPDKDNFNTIHSLVTSRHDAWGKKSDFGEMECYGISIFSDAESVKFLQGKHVFGSSATADQIQELAKSLHYLPLAIRQAAAYIKRKNDMDHEFDIEKFLREFKNNPEVFLHSHNLDDYNHSIYGAFMEEYDLIEKKPNSGQLAAIILSITSYFASSAIDYELLCSLNDYSEAEFFNSLHLLRERSIIVYSSRMARFETMDLFQKIVRIRNKDSEEKHLKLALGCFEGSTSNMTHLKKVWDYAKCYPRLLQDFKALLERSEQMPLNVHEYSANMNNACLHSSQNEAPKFIDASQDKHCQEIANI